MFRGYTSGKVAKEHLYIRSVSFMIGSPLAVGKVSLKDQSFSSNSKNISGQRENN